VQQRFPQVGGLNVDKRDRRFLPLAELVAQLGGEFESSGTAAYDYDVMQIGCHGRARGLCSVVRPADYTWRAGGQHL
jgi:hypothetical protein